MVISLLICTKYLSGPSWYFVNENEYYGREETHLFEMPV